VGVVVYAGGDGDVMGWLIGYIARVYKKRRRRKRACVYWIAEPLEGMDVSR
jgi:hypothetical protein